MYKGITIPGVELSKDDIQNLKDSGIDTIFIASDSIDKMNDVYIICRNVGIKKVIMDIGWGTFDQSQWKNVIDKFNADIYYLDEPYLVRPQWYIDNRGYSEDEAKEAALKDIIFRRDYIKEKRPNSKFVIGDIRVLLDKNYKPLDDVWYTYTSYTNNIVIPIIGKALPIGLGNQSPAIKRVYKNVNGKVPFVWLYGENKLLCHPDEYHKVLKTCDELGIDTTILYARDGMDNGKYEFNKVSKEQLLEYINHYIKGDKPYTFFEWWKRLFHRLGLSFRELFKTWDFKEFIDKLF